MRCCKHYSPSADHMERHDGLQINDAYQFDKLLPHPSCTNEAVSGSNPFGGCPFSRNQDKCNYYEAEKVQVLKSAQVEQLGLPETRVCLEVARVTFGIVEFYITHYVEGKRVVHHTVNAHEHAEESQKMADELFGYELNNFSDAKVTSLPIEDDTSNSYLLEVTNAVPTPA